jgi:ABC-type transporter Mla subunit MlaD
VRTPLTWIEKVVGAFVLVIFFILGATLFVTAQRHNVFNLRKPFEIFTFTAEGYGLKNGAPVKILDVEAGVVTDVRLVREAERDQDDPAHFARMVRVSMRIDNDQAELLSVSTTAVIERPPIGGSFVTLVTDPRYLVVGRLPNGAKIDSSVPPSLLEKVATIKDDVAKVKDNVVETLQNLQTIIANVKVTTDDIVRGKGIVGRAINNPVMAEQLEATLASARSTADELRAAAANAAKASEPVPAAAQEAKSLIEDVRGTVSKVDRALEPLADVVASVRRALRDVEALVANLREASDRVPEIARKAEKGLEETNRTIEAAQKSFLIRGNLPDRPAVRSEAEALPRGDR